MPIDPQPLLRPARRFHLVCRAVFLVLIGLALALILGVLLSPDRTGRMLIGFAGFDGVSPRPWQMAVLAGLLLGQIALWAAVFGTAGRVCGDLVAGRVDQAGARARRLSGWLWAAFAGGLAAHMLGLLAATWHFPAGQRMIGISLGSAQLSTALAALMAAFLARAFSLGALLWQDHREMV